MRSERDSEAVTSAFTRTSMRWMVVPALLLSLAVKGVGQAPAYHVIASLEGLSYDSLVADSAGNFYGTISGS